MTEGKVDGKWVRHEKYRALAKVTRVYDSGVLLVEGVQIRNDGARPWVGLVRPEFGHEYEIIDRPEFDGKDAWARDFLRRFRPCLLDHPTSPEAVAMVAPSDARPRFPHRCDCGMPAYRGFLTIECSGSLCRFGGKG